MFVSVIIPSFKGSCFVAESVESVLKQKDVKTEIIVVDDNGEGSNEQVRTFNSLRQYIISKKIVYICHKTNKNGSSARNTGLRYAKGDYVAFLDDDDIFEPEKLVKQIKCMQLSNFNASLCGFYRFYENGNKSFVNIEPSSLNLESLLSLNADTCAGSGLVINRCLLKNNMEFDESFQRFQDIEFLIRIRKETRICLVNDCLLGVRMHSHNESNIGTSGKKYEKSMLHFLETFQSDIDSLSNSKKVIRDFYYRIAKNYYKQKDFKQYLKWVFATKRPITYFLKSVKDYFRKKNGGL